MDKNKYIDRVRKCQRCYWFESGISLDTLKRLSPRKVTGYAVHRLKNKIALVADFVLGDSVAVRRLALTSTPRRLTGWLVRPESDVTFETKITL